MELRDYLRVLRKYWILITALALVGVALGAGASIFATPKYQASTQLYVSVRGDGAAVGELAQGSTLARQSVSTYAAIATTESVLGPVIDELRLETSAAALASQVEAKAPENQSIVTVTVTDSDPNRTASIANAVGKSLKTVVEEELEASATRGNPSLVSLNTVQPANLPSSPVSPRVPLNIALGGLLGLAAGIGIAALRYTLDTRIHSLQDIEQLTEMPVLGGITYDETAEKRPLIVHSNPRSPRAEAFRTLRTNVEFLAVNAIDEHRGRSFVVSSAGPGEGKSTTSANLALALAETGSRVLLVDGDLRMPAIARYMGIEGGVGLTDVLIGRAEVSDVLQRWGQDELYVIPSGKIPPNPSELLGSRAMDELIEMVIDHFDYVIIDAPPILLVTDAAVLSKRTNGALLVAASGSTRKQALAGAVQSLGIAGGIIAGIIVTMLPTKGPDSYAYGAYGAYGAYAAQDGTNTSRESDEFILGLPQNRIGRRVER